MSGATARRDQRRARLGTVGPPVMDPAAALWVLDTVMPWHQGWPVLPCSCLYGMCGACEAGQHARCLDDQQPPAARRGDPETWITDRRGFIRYGPTSTVWLADRTCRYRCPCACPVVELTSAEQRPEQLNLFALTRDDDEEFEQGDLFAEPVGAEA